MNGEKILDDEMATIWKEAVVVYSTLGLLSEIMFGGTDDTARNLIRKAASLFAEIRTQNLMNTHQKC
jgi:hypothetical protein